MIPKKFEYAPVRRDETETIMQKSVMEELEVRKQKLKERLATLKVDSEEIWKSMESAEKTLSEMVRKFEFSRLKLPYAHQITFIEFSRRNVHSHQLNIRFSHLD